ncbi:hypothetical protein RhiirA4_423837 [Rhizophagus irregularis]|uniref:Uncharacterized protein n=1 Tax=Rhizophagus irregularis TaxID=588596 RepID=A0A2I1GV96_9GLOM|nr:hypothetical protein RhiirA4_423837 [Rhizophagus irregularis]
MNPVFKKKFVLKIHKSCLSLTTHFLDTNFSGRNVLPRHKTISCEQLLDSEFSGFLGGSPLFYFNETLFRMYLTFVFSLNRQFSKQTVDKYFVRIRQLLQEKYLALRNRVESDKMNNKRTKTYIRFSSGDHMIYLGFFFSCGGFKDNNHCILPAAYVLSRNCWRCNEHHRDCMY